MLLVQQKNADELTELPGQFRTKRRSSQGVSEFLFRSGCVQKECSLTARSMQKNSDTPHGQVRELVFPADSLP